MTQKEKNLTKQIKELKKYESELESQLKDNPKSKKSKFKEGLTTSTLVMYVVTGCFFVGVVFGIYIILQVVKLCPENLVGIMIALFSYLGGGAGAFWTVYTLKSKSDHKLMFAMEICEKLTDNEITPQSIYWSKVLEEESSTSMTNISPYGGVTQVDSVNYMAQNPMANTVSNSEDVINTPATDNMAQG